MESLWANNKECPVCGFSTVPEIRSCETGLNYCSIECARKDMKKWFEDMLAKEEAEPRPMTLETLIMHMQPIMDEEMQADEELQGALLSTVRDAWKAAEEAEE